MRGDKSELVNFVAYYGVGTVRENEMGILLPPGAETVSISQVKRWFTESFGLDPNRYSVSIQSFWSKSPINI